jgi:hypothetical protein
VTMFIAAGTIEGFVTGERAGPAVRVAIGVVAWTAFATYLVVCGRAAAARASPGRWARWSGGRPPPRPRSIPAGLTHTCVSRAASRTGRWWPTARDGQLGVERLPAHELAEQLGPPTASVGMATLSSPRSVNT